MLKRLAKLGISLILRGWDALGECLNRLAGRLTDPLCVVLYYHGIAPALKQRFARQMDYATRLAKPVAADFNGNLAPGQRYFAVTFDDGFVSTLENALPALQERGIPTTIFVPTGSLGSRPGWVNNPASPAWSETVMTAEQVRELKRFRMLTIGAHSITHPNFQAIDRAQAERELRLCKVELEALSGRPVDLFSFPHGNYSVSSLELAKAAGYKRVFSIAPEPAKAAVTDYVVGRVLADPGDWPLEFKLKLLGAYRWMACIQVEKKQMNSARQ